MNPDKIDPLKYKLRTDETVLSKMLTLKNKMNSLYEEFLKSKGLDNAHDYYFSKLSFDMQFRDYLEAVFELRYQSRFLKLDCGYYTDDERSNRVNTFVLTIDCDSSFETEGTIAFGFYTFLEEYHPDEAPFQVIFKRS